MSESPQLSKLRKLNFYETRGLVSLISPEDEKDGENDSPNVQPAKSLHFDSIEENRSENNTPEFEEWTFVEDENQVQDSQPLSVIPEVPLVKSAEEFCKKNRIDASRCKVFVGNISYKVRNRELREFFEYFGKVLHVQIVKDRIKKRSKGFGFVIFSNEYEADRAKAAPNHELMLDGRVMKVSTPQRRKQRNVRFQEHGDAADVPTLQEAVADFEMSMKKDNIEDTPEGPISRLNDDTLVHIFSYLNVKEKVLVERVCRRWREVAPKSWHFVKHLDFSGVFVSFTGTGGLTDNILMSIFKRGCPQLESLDLSGSPRHLTDFSLHLIGKFCPGLKSINLTGVAITKSAFKCLAEKCPNLQNFKLVNSVTTGEKDLWWLFKCCRDLRVINISGNKRISGQCFFMLHEPCHTLILSDCSKLSDAGLQLIGRRCPDLKTIDLQGCSSITDEGLSSLFQSCTKIETLNMRRTFPQVTQHGLSGFQHLTSLQELHLYKNIAVSDTVLYTLGKSCHSLRILNIGGCHKDVTDAGMQSLVMNMMRLEELNMNNLENVTDAGIKALASMTSLKKLQMSGCVSVTDEGPIALLLECRSLEQLDVSGCVNVTDTFLNTVHEVCSDEEHPILEVTVGGTAMTEERITHCQSAPQCVINKSDLSSMVFNLETFRDLSFVMEGSSDDDDVYDAYDDEDDDDFDYDYGFNDADAEDFLVADDPAMMADLEWS